MQSSSHQSQRLIKILASSIFGILASKFNTLLKHLSDQTSRGINSLVFACNVDFHSGFLVDTQFLGFVDGGTETGVVFAGIVVVVVILEKKS